MSIYRFRVIDKDDRPIAGQFIHCENDDAARQHARALADRAKLIVEIWEGDRQVTKRDSPSEAA